MEDKCLYMAVLLCVHVTMSHACAHMVSLCNSDLHMYKIVVHRLDDSGLLPPILPPQVSKLVAIQSDT